MPSRLFRLLFSVKQKRMGEYHLNISHGANISRVEDKAPKPIQGLCHPPEDLYQSAVYYLWTVEYTYEILDVIW